MKKTVIIALIVALLSAGAGFGSCYAIVKTNPNMVGIYAIDDEDDEDDEDSEKQDDEKDSGGFDLDSDAQSNVPKTAELRVGDSVTAGHFKYTFVSYNGYAHEANDDGERGIRIEILVENISSEIRYSNIYIFSDWHIDNEIIDIDPCWDLEDDDDCNRGTGQNMTAGQKISVVGYYDINASAKSVKLVTNAGDTKNTDEYEFETELTFICEE